MPVRVNLGALAGLLLVGLSGCGGSSPSTSPSTSSSTTTAVVAAAPSTTTRSTTSRARPSRRHHRAAPASPPTSTATSTPRSRPAAPPHPPRAHRVTGRSTAKTQAAQIRHLQGTAVGPSPATCLRRIGLIDVKLFSPGSWEAKDPVGGAQVFVDGPFRSPADARGDAASLAPVQAVAAGGLYVASANLSGHETGTVQDVARCLAPSHGHGGMTF